ncbi:MAG: DUF2807 domain-containing protein [Bacteroidetes bacterium]|nr:DUF2807 domain-containing protein [Bacteroidota bacterium]
MNNLFILSGMFLLLTVLTTSLNLSAQTIYGNGNVSEENRTLSSFDEIESDGVMNVFLKQGGTESVTIKGDKNILPYIETKVTDRRLVISVKKGITLKDSHKLSVYVTLKDLTALRNNGVGNLRSENKLDLNDLKIINNGVGNIDLEFDCNRLDLEINSVGNNTFSGNADIVDILHNGVGNLNAFDLTADKLKIVSNSVGNADVRSEREIDITLNGTGNVFYKGSASIKRSEKNGIGNIKKM